MNSTDFVAWWGAITATVVFVWDIYKWKTQGPQLELSLSPNMQVLGDPAREGIQWVSITVTNVGDRPTTIKGVGMKYYRNWWQRIRNRAEKAAVFPNPNDSYPLPRILKPGDEWVGLVPQARSDLGIDLPMMSRTGHLVIWLTQSHKPNSLKKRLRVRN